MRRKLLTNGRKQKTEGTEEQIQINEEKGRISTQIKLNERQTEGIKAHFG